MYWMTYLWPRAKVMAVALINKNACLYDNVRTIHSITTRLHIYIFLVMPINRLNFGGILFFFLAIFFSKFQVCFFTVKHSFDYILRMVGPIHMKRKRSASVRCWTNCVTLTFDLTHDFIYLYLRNFGVMNVKQKGSKSLGYQTNYVTFLFDHTHDLDLEFSTSKFEIALSHDCDLCVIMVRWVDLPDSAGGVFRCRHAVDTSSYEFNRLRNLYFR